MTDQNANTENTTTDAQTAPKPKRANASGEGRTTVAKMAIERSKRKQIPTDRAAKEVRGLLRREFDHVVKLDPTIKRAKTAHNDGNRWPAMNAKVAAFVRTGKK